MTEKTSKLMIKDLLPIDLNSNELWASIFKDKITLSHLTRSFDKSKKAYTKVSIPPLKPHLDRDLYLPEEDL